jgi:hypothetical protein
MFKAFAETQNQPRKNLSQPQNMSLSGSSKSYGQQVSI